MKKLTKQLVRIIIALTFFTVIFMVDCLIDLNKILPTPYGWLFPFLLYLGVYWLIGYDVLWKAVRNIVRGQFFDENFLMTIATCGAFGLAIYRGVNGQPSDGFCEACAVLLFYQIGEWLQKLATQRSRRSIAELLNLRPDYANRLDGKEIIKIDPTEVKIGELIVVNPGEKIPLDGVVVSGISALDTKALTGEALPRNVAPGNSVISGTVNLTSQITVKVTKTFYASTVNKILDLVENAANRKAKTENFITKFARYYTPIVVMAAALLVVIPGVITRDWATWIYRALSFLVVSCPCALVISIPLSFFAGLGVASRHGIMVKGANYLEQLNRANIFVFDKTGTLTKGNFVVTAVKPVARKAEILRLAAIAEKNSTHPIARAIVAALGQEDLPHDYALTNVAGLGVIASKGDTTIYCGSEKLLREHQIVFSPLPAAGTVVYVAKNKTYVGAITIQDEIKDETAAVIKDLQQSGNRTIMLTGDNATVAAEVAERIGLSTYQAALLPQEKTMVVEELLTKKQRHEVLCFVGDGINDAPVLMRADIGVAMGGVGSDAAIEAADVILMQDDLRKLKVAKKIAHQTMTIVKENICLTLGIKLLILVLAAIGLTNMWLAVFGDVGVAIITILNALRIKIIFNKRESKTIATKNQKLLANDSSKE